jgi:hypothetical protein
MTWQPVRRFLVEFLEALVELHYQLHEAYLWGPLTTEAGTGYVWDREIDGEPKFAGIDDSGHPSAEMTDPVYLVELLSAAIPSLLAVLLVAQTALRRIARGEGPGRPPPP